MARSTTIKDALKRWQEEHDGQDPVEAVDIHLQFRWPPIEKMDGTLGTLEVVGDTLEELWISYNLIDKLKGVESLRKLKVLYMANNSVRDWGELAKLQAISGTLEDLVFAGNPLVENLDETAYVREVTKRLPTLKKLDGVPMLTEEED
uniref:NXF1/2/3/5-like leucine-rich repeat domain-containing protein n=1 Tax=Anopheles farauti TaxID=69004 RepID=A0A182Q3C2_9DIPT